MSIMFDVWMERMSSRANAAKTMELLLLLGFLVAWIILQTWVLPRFGVKT